MHRPSQGRIVITGRFVSKPTATVRSGTTISVPSNGLGRAVSLAGIGRLNHRIHRLTGPAATASFFPLSAPDIAYGNEEVVVERGCERIVYRHLQISLPFPSFHFGDTHDQLVVVVSSRYNRSRNRLRLMAPWLQCLQGTVLCLAGAPRIFPHTPYMSA